MRRNTSGASRPILALWLLIVIALLIAALLIRTNSPALRVQYENDPLN
jgi:type II secretory pathway component PulK